MGAEETGSPRIALLTYSVKPRGGVVHTLELAEALHDLGASVEIVAMGDPDLGFYRPVGVPVHIVQAPPWGDTLEERVFRWIDALTVDLGELAPRFDILHPQDCISARAAARVRDAGADVTVIRTVHHVDDFTTRALIDCQDAAISEPDEVLVVSRQWQHILERDHGRSARIVTNGIRAERFAKPPADLDPMALRRSIGAEDRFLWLTMGGIEPRKGSVHLVRALSALKAATPEDQLPPQVAVIGGHSFQDHQPYAEAVLASLPDLGLEEDRDLIRLGTLDDDEVVAWMHASDAFVFPSVNEGWGLAPLEAMAAGLPVVASDLEVFHEFLEGEVDAILTRTGDDASLAEGMTRLMADAGLRRRLADGAPAVADRFPWRRTAEQHLEIYRSLPR